MKKSIAILLLLASPALAYHPDHDTELIRRWTLDGDTDEVVNGDTAAVVSAPTYQVARVLDGILLDGTDDAVDTATVADIGYNDNSVTITFWHKGGNVTDKVLFSQWDVTTAAEKCTIRISENLGDLRVQLSNDGSDTYFKDYTSSIAVRDGTWHHIAVVLDDVDTSDADSELFIYVDAVLDGSPTKTVNGNLTGMYDSGADILIGADRDTAGMLDNFANGVFDDVRIYNDAKSLAEIELIYDHIVRPKVIVDAQNDLGCRSTTDDATFDNSYIIQQFLDNRWKNYGNILWFPGEQFSIYRTLRVGNRMMGGRINGTSTVMRPHDESWTLGPSSQLVWRGPTLPNERDGIITVGAGATDTFATDADRVDWTAVTTTDDVWQLIIYEGDMKGLYDVASRTAADITLTEDLSGNDKGDGDDDIVSGDNLIDRGGDAPLAWSLRLGSKPNAATGNITQVGPTRFDDAKVSDWTAIPGLTTDSKLIIQSNSGDSVTTDSNPVVGIYDILDINASYLELDPDGGYWQNPEVKDADLEWEIINPMVIVEGYGVYFDGLSLRGRYDAALATEGNYADCGFLIRGQTKSVGSGKHFFSTGGTSHCVNGVMFGESATINNADNTHFGPWQANWCHTGFWLRNNQNVECSMTYYQPYNTRVGVGYGAWGSSSGTGGGKLTIHKAEVTTSHTDFLQFRGTPSGDTAATYVGEIVFDNNAAAFPTSNRGFRCVQGYPGGGNSVVIRIGTFYGPDNVAAVSTPWFDLYGATQLVIESAYYIRDDAIKCNAVGGLSPTVILSNARTSTDDGGNIRDVVDSASDPGYRFIWENCMNQAGVFFTDGQSGAP